MYRQLEKLLGGLPCHHTAAGGAKCIPGDKTCTRALARGLLVQLVPNGGRTAPG